MNNNQRGNKTSIFKIASTHRGKCFICLKNYKKLHTVKKDSILCAYNQFKIIINHKSMHCRHHLDEYGIIKQDQYDLIPWNIKKVDVKSLNKSKLFDCDIFKPFNNVDDITEKYCHQITGWTKSQFMRFCNYITSINNTENRTREELIAMYRYWLRKGLDQYSLALLKTQSSQQQISYYLSSIRIAINKDFVKYYLGCEKKRDFFLRHNNISTVKLHQLNNEELAIFADATYCRIEKSADNLFQYNTWSQQKLDLLIKPFIICCSDGYIIDVYGPYNANKNDASIFDHILETDNNLRNILLPYKTICFLDRGKENYIFGGKIIYSKLKTLFIEGFRDIHTKLVEHYGYRVEIPHCKQLDAKIDDNEKKNNKQLSTSDANRTRNVTKVYYHLFFINLLYFHS